MQLSEWVLHPAAVERSTLRRNAAFSDELFIQRALPEYESVDFRSFCDENPQRKSHSEKEKGVAKMPEACARVVPMLAKRQKAREKWADRVVECTAQSDVTTFAKL